LDEVHEREEDMDFLLLLCKKLLPEASRTTKLILMSATIQINEFRDYFNFCTGIGELRYE
jgi:HrpA-like RNA helicase